MLQWGTPAQARAFGTCMLADGFLMQGYLNLTLAHVAMPDLLERYRNAFLRGLEAALGAPVP